MLSNFHKEINLYLKNRGDNPYPKHIEYALINANPTDAVYNSQFRNRIRFQLFYWIDIYHILFCRARHVYNFNPLS